jgi:hypothetical protein
MRQIDKLPEITFGGNGCVLSVELKNMNDRETLEKNLYQCKDALRQYPKSKYLKDAITFIEKKLERESWKK